MLLLDVAGSVQVLPSGRVLIWHSRSWRRTTALNCAHLRNIWSYSGADTGRQSQFSVGNSIGTPCAPGLRQVVAAVVADPAADHALAAMAERAALGGRQLMRLFAKEIGISPGRYVEQVRCWLPRHCSNRQPTGRPPLCGSVVSVPRRRCGASS
ncbi:hypothetical protein [Nocardia sp. NPDC050412]|uniref:hypothetical protein n=1 Tax=Nocardia sp. NPDC050412 TaxID=3364320 RepID=UPI0037B38DBA